MNANYKFAGWIGDGTKKRSFEEILGEILTFDSQLINGAKNVWLLVSLRRNINNDISIKYLLRNLDKGCYIYLTKIQVKRLLKRYQSLLDHNDDNDSDDDLIVKRKQILVGG